MAKKKSNKAEETQPELPCEPDVEKSILGLFLLSPDRFYEAAALG